MRQIDGEAGIPARGVFTYLPGIEQQYAVVGTVFGEPASRGKTRVSGADDDPVDLV